MAETPKLPQPDVPRPAGVPKPPTEADIAQVSEDQELIADEWGVEPPETPPPER